MANLTPSAINEAIIGAINEGVCIIDTQNIVIFVNQQLTEIIGYTADEILGKSSFDFVNTQDIESFKHRVQRRKVGQLAAHNYQIPCKNGTKKWVSMNARPIVENGQLEGMIITILDTSEQKINAQLMEENFRHYVSLFEDSPIPIWDEDFSQIKNEVDKLKAEGITDFRCYLEENPSEIARISEKLIVNNVNKAVVVLNEAESKAYVLQNFRKNATEDSTEHAILQIIAIANNQMSCEFDVVLKTFKGNKRFVHLKWAVVQGYEEDYSRVYLSTTDLTDRIKEENLVLQRSNLEKEMMLKEIHHRVKNNLQIVSSLLKLQSYTIQDDAVNEIFAASLNRINSMSKVHELLYQSTEFSQINYKDYLVSLIGSLVNTMKGKNQQIAIDLQVNDIAININTAIPLGLLINEIVTNSIKHGLSNIEKGSIYLHIDQLNEEEFNLKIGDNGKGFIKPIHEQSSDTLGMSLIDSLAEQLNGQIFQLHHTKGTHFNLAFSKLK
ncbi:MAG: histidine kinase dimerization/phosphoacceptor domain -containing protein [Bacteroidota bacterium]